MNITARTGTRDLSFIALMAALMAVCAWITIPFSPVPFTLQTFGVFTALALLGGRRGFLAILLYLCLGLAGLPVFSGFSGGAGVLFGATGGYLLGFVATGLVYWAMTARLGESLPVKAAGLLLGMAVCYAVGTAWFLRVYAEPTSLGAALLLCVVPFIPVDLIKLALALTVSRRVGQAIHI